MGMKPDRKEDVILTWDEFDAQYTSFIDFYNLTYWLGDGEIVKIWYTDEYRYRKTLERIDEIMKDWDLMLRDALDEIRKELNNVL